MRQTVCRRADGMDGPPGTIGAAQRKPRKVSARMESRSVSNRQEISLASIVIFAFSTCETGQPVSAALAASSNFALSAPGIFTVTSRCEEVMEKPASVLSNVIVAVVSMLSAVIPALPNCADSAMLKQPAWAAAMSSSGFVPMPFSKRVLKEYWVLFRTPLAVETLPLPSFNPPDQWALALRCISSSLSTQKLLDSSYTKVENCVQSQIVRPRPPSSAIAMRELADCNTSAVLVKI